MRLILVLVALGALACSRYDYVKTSDGGVVRVEKATGRSERLHRSGGVDRWVAVDSGPVAAPVAFPPTPEAQPLPGAVRSQVDFEGGMTGSPYSEYGKTLTITVTNRSAWTVTRVQARALVQGVPRLYDLETGTGPVYSAPVKVAPGQAATLFARLEPYSTGEWDIVEVAGYPPPVAQAR